MISIISQGLGGGFPNFIIQIVTNRRTLFYTGLGVEFQPNISQSSILLLPESFNPFCICERDKYISFPLYGNVDRKHYRTETYILNPDLYPTQRKFQLYKIYWRAFCADLNTDQLNVKPLVLGLPLVVTFNVTLVIFAVGACGIIILFQLYLVDVILVDL